MFIYFHRRSNEDDSVNNRLIYLYELGGDTPNLIHEVEEHRWTKTYTIKNNPLNYTFTLNGKFVVDNGKLKYVSKSGVEKEIPVKVRSGKGYKLVGFDFVPFSVGGIDKLLLIKYLNQGGSRKYFVELEIFEAKVGRDTPNSKQTIKSVFKSKPIDLNKQGFFINWFSNYDKGIIFFKLSDNYGLGVSPTSVFEITTNENHNELYAPLLTTQDDDVIIPYNQDENYTYTVLLKYSKNGKLEKKYTNVLGYNENYILVYNTKKGNLTVYDAVSGNQISELNLDVNPNEENNYVSISYDGKIVVSKPNGDIQEISLYNLKGNRLGVIQAPQLYRDYQLIPFGKLNGGNKYIGYVVDKFVLMDFDKGEIKQYKNLEDILKLGVDWFNLSGVEWWIATNVIISNGVKMVRIFNQNNLYITTVGDNPQLLTLPNGNLPKINKDIVIFPYLDKECNHTGFFLTYNIKENNLTKLVEVEKYTNRIREFSIGKLC